MLMRRVSGGLGPACRPHIQAGRPSFLDTAGWKGQRPPPPLPPGPGLGNKGSRVTDTSALCPEPFWAPQKGQGSTGNWEEPPCPSQHHSPVGRQIANRQLQVDEEGWVGDAGRAPRGSEDAARACAPKAPGPSPDSEERQIHGQGAGGFERRDGGLSCHPALEAGMEETTPLRNRSLTPFLAQGSWSRSRHRGSRADRNQNV